MNSAFQPIADLGHRELLAYGYALINPMRVPASEWKDLPVVPLGSPAFEGQPHLLPRLLPLAELDDDAKANLLERNARQWSTTGQSIFCALLESDVDTRMLAGNLGRQMLVQGPTGSTVWLRFHDPRVFSGLTWWLDKDQLRRLFGPVETWAWPEPRDAHWHHLHRPELPSPNASRLKLTGEQWGRLQRQPLVNRCVRQLTGGAPVDEDLRGLVERLDAYICRAIAAGTVNQRDICQFALQAERNGLSRIEEPA